MGSVDGGGRGAEVEADAVILVNLLDEAAELAAQNARHRQRLGRDDMHLDVPRPQRRRDFEPYEARPDDDGTPRILRPPDDRLAVGERAQVADMREIGAGQVEADRLGSRGDEQRAIAEAAAVFELALAAGGVDRPGRRAKTQLDALLAVEIRRAQRNPLGG